MTIIDAHGHVSLPAEAYAYQAALLASRGNPHSGGPKLGRELHEKAMRKTLDMLDAVGTDVQLISPRPFHLMHSVRPRRIVETWTRFVNDAIKEQVDIAPDRFIGVAGLPQYRDETVEPCLSELERCVNELGFVGALLNPDPMEGEGAVPGLSQRFWYPLYEKACELDVPLHVHSGSCVSERESYTLHFINEESIAIMELLESQVFSDFPQLKIMISHGGGAIPYHSGRFRSWRIRRGLPSFEDDLRRLYYDTCVYTEEGLELLIKVIGADRVLFGTEAPGTGSAIDPATGRQLDNMRPLVEASPLLSDVDREKIFSGNVTEVFKLRDRIESVTKEATHAG